MDSKNTGHCMHTMTALDTNDYIIDHVTFPVSTDVDSSAMHVTNHGTHSMILPSKSSHRKTLNLYHNLDKLQTIEHPGQGCPKEINSYMLMKQCLHAEGHNLRCCMEIATVRGLDDVRIRKRTDSGLPVAISFFGVILRPFKKKIVRRVYLPGPPRTCNL